MSLYYDSGVLVKLYAREESSDTVARFLATRGEPVIVNDLHEIETRNALRLKRFRDETTGNWQRPCPCSKRAWRPAD